MKKLWKWFKIRHYKNCIIRLEQQIMFFEIPYDMAIIAINRYENRIKELENE